MPNFLFKSVQTTQWRWDEVHSVFASTKPASVAHLLHGMFFVVHVGTVHIFTETSSATEVRVY